MFRPGRQHRYQALKNAGMLPFEAYKLSKVPYKHAPWIKQMMDDRIELLTPLRHQADQLNWSPAKYQQEKRDYIYYTYQEKGMTYTKLKRPFGKIRPDIWQLFREARAEAIAQGKWDETPRRRKPRSQRPDKIKVERGNVRAQKARRREVDRAKRQMIKEGSSIRPPRNWESM